MEWYNVIGMLSLTIIIWEPDRLIPRLFLSSVEFCKHVKFDDKDDRNDNRDNRTGLRDPRPAQGPIGPEAPKGDTRERQV